MQATIGFIGTGVMGAPMATNLVRAGFRVRAYDRRADSVAALVADGVEAASGLAEAVNGAGFVITMLPDTPDVEEVALGKGGLVRLLPAGVVVIDMSTIAASAGRRIAEALAARGVAFLDAPVSGGVAGARAGTLSIMVGGEEAAFERARRVLAAMGTTILHAGPPGMGQVFKMCNQLVCAIHIQAMCEAFALCRAQGGDLERLRGALQGGAAASWMLDRLGPQVIAKDPSAGFRIDLQLKDLRIAGEAAFERGVPLPGLALATSLYLEARAHDEGRNGNQALYRVYDRMTAQEHGE